MNAEQSVTNTRPVSPSLLAIVNFAADNGTERMISSVLQGLSSHLHVLLLSAQKTGVFFAALQQHVCTVGRLRLHRKSGAFWINAALIYLRLLIHRPAILMVFNYQWGLPAGAALRWMPRGLRPQQAVLVHHISVAAVTSNTELKRMCCYFPYFSNHIVPSYSLCAELAATVPTIHKQTLQAIHNGLDLEAVRKSSRKFVPFVSVQTCRWHCVYVGGLRSDKRVDRLLRCFSRLPEKENTLLTLVGDGEERQTLEKLAETLGIRNRCQFVGHQQNPYPYIAGADLLVQATDWETFGLSLLESMALKTAVLAMKGHSQGLLDVVHDKVNGRLVEHDDEDGFITAWSELLQKKDMRDVLVARGYDDAANFTVEKMIAAYRNLLGLQ